MAGCKLVGEQLHGAVAGLAGAVVLRCVGGREQQVDLVASEERAHGVGDEGGAVVGLEHERRAMPGDQRAQDVDGGGGVRGGDRGGGERAAGGEVADGEHVAVVALDGRRRFGVVERPDPSRASPGDAAVVAPGGDVIDLGAREVEQAAEVAARQRREMVLQDGDAERGAMQRKEVEHIAALDLRAGQWLGAERDGREAVGGVVPAACPGGEGRGIQAERGRRAAA